MIFASRLLAPRRVAIVTVWEERLTLTTSALGIGAAGMAPVDQELIDEIERDAHDHADRVSRSGAALARSLGLEAESIARCEADSIADTIVATAREARASVIVAGSHGLGGALSRLLGGTCSALIDAADCPLLNVRDDDSA